MGLNTLALATSKTLAESKRLKINSTKIPNNIPRMTFLVTLRKTISNYLQSKNKKIAYYT